MSSRSFSAFLTNTGIGFLARLSPDFWFSGMAVLVLSPGFPGLRGCSRRSGALMGCALLHLCDPQLKDMPPGTGAPHFPKTSSLECRNEAHEPVTRRLRIDRISLHNRYASGFGKVDGSSNDSLCDAQATQPADNEEAGD